jgi:hypothetical protein
LEKNEPTGGLWLLDWQVGSTRQWKKRRAQGNGLGKRQLGRGLDSNWAGLVAPVQNLFLSFFSSFFYSFLKF